MNSKLFKSSLIPNPQNISGEIAWQSPSNIALVKYWGKFGVQLPKNPSISIGLTEAHTQMRIKYELKSADKAIREFLFEGKENPAFGKKVLDFLTDLELLLPFLTQLDLNIESSNSFPHSAGIASSASSMSALALCLCSMEHDLLGDLEDDYDFYTKASYIARLGSGSASRSVYGGFSVWGEYIELIESSNEYAVPFTYEVHPLFMQLRDSILIVSDTEKAVSSRAGHALMNNHPYADARIAQSKQNMSWLIAALLQGDTDRFIEVVENEAMSLHGLMMSSKPWYSLLHANTIKILEKIRIFREQSGIFICFTLDAGPNVHLLYTQEDERRVMQFIEEDLLEYCHEQNVIHDKIGNGPQRLK